MDRFALSTEQLSGSSQTVINYEVIPFTKIFRTYLEQFPSTEMEEMIISESRFGFLHCRRLHFAHGGIGFQDGEVSWKGGILTAHPRDWLA